MFSRSLRASLGALTKFAIALGCFAAMTLTASATGGRDAYLETTTTTDPQNGQYTRSEILDAGHVFFGEMSGGLASIIENAGSQNKLPNGYILGEEGSGAFIGGLRYGEGVLYTRNAGQYRVYWQGPSVGMDFGGEGSRVMMLVYDLPSIDKMYSRYVGINGSAYAVSGLSVEAMGKGETLVMPVRTGVGARLGVNMGYLKFTQQPTWNPF